MVRTGEIERQHLPWGRSPAGGPLFDRKFLTQSRLLGEFLAVQAIFQEWPAPLADRSLLAARPSLRQGYCPPSTGRGRLRDARAPARKGGAHVPAPAVRHP